MKFIIQTCAAIVAVVGVVASAWAAADWLEVRPVFKRELIVIQTQVAQLSQATLRIQFENLMQRRQYGGLSFDEQQTLCQIAKILNYVGVPGC